MRQTIHRAPRRDVGTDHCLAFPGQLLLAIILGWINFWWSHLWLVFNTSSQMEKNKKNTSLRSASSLCHLYIMSIISIVKLSLTWWSSPLRLWTPHTEGWTCITCRWPSRGPGFGCSLFIMLCCQILDCLNNLYNPLFQTKWLPEV